MKKKRRAEADLYEAVVWITVRQLHGMLDESLDEGSLARHLDQLEDALDVDEDGVWLDSFYWELIAREAQRHFVDLEDERPGARPAAEAALRAALIEELRPHVGGKKRLARRAGALLAVLFDEAEQADRWARRLR